MKTSKILNHTLWAVTVVLVPNISVSVGLAADVLWDNVGTGAWDDTSNWQSGSLPGSTDRAFVNNGGTVQVDATTSPSPSVNSFWLAQSGGDSGNFEMSGGTFAAREARFGEGGTANATITGGDFTIGSNSIFVGGRDSIGTGVLTINGADASVSSGDDFQLGRVGDGTLNLQNGQASGIFTVVGKFGSGLWNQSGGSFRVRADLEIGDGGRPDQAGIAGPREGTIDLSGGVLHVNDNVAIGNRNGKGTVNASGGWLSATGKSNSSIYVGRGMDWSAGQGDDVELRVTGSDSTIIANGDFLMNTTQVATSSTLVAEITGTDHTTIKVAGDANITNGILSVELNGYTPVNGDSWTLIETGADLADDKQSIDEFLAANEFDSVNHASPSSPGTVMGTFDSLDLPAGFEVSYTDTEVILNFVQESLPCDFDGDGVVGNGDLTLLLTSWGGAPGPNWINDVPEIVGNDSLSCLLTNWGATLELNHTNVPEPSSMILSAITVSLGLCMSRRRK